MRSMLSLAVEQDCDALVLGAWGCGVFANEPQQVAALLAEQLLEKEHFAHVFRHISFSIPDNPEIADNTRAFQKYFA